MESVSMAVMAGYVLSVLSALLCVVWGVLNWNRTGEPDEPIAEVVRWATEEDQEAKK